MLESVFISDGSRTRFDSETSWRDVGSWTRLFGTQAVGPCRVDSEHGDRSADSAGTSVTGDTVSVMESEDGKNN